MKDEKIYWEALKKWGAESQIKMMMEECGELVAALNQYDRGKITAGQVCDEIADVEIMCGQMKILFGPEVDNCKVKKIDRLEKMLQMPVETRSTI